MRKALTGKTLTVDWCPLCGVDAVIPVQAQGFSVEFGVCLNCHRCQECCYKHDTTDQDTMREHLGRDLK